MTDDSILRLADLPRPAGEKHEMDPPHHLCLGDDPCICIHLAACEQRVRDEERGWEGAVVIARAGYEDGYAAALNAAREAVAAVEDQWDAEIDYDRDYAFDPSGGTRNPRIWLRDALDAIDALRQEKK